MLAPSWGLAVTAAALLLATTLLSLAGPSILRYAIDRGLRSGHADLRVLRNAGASFLALALLSLVLVRLQTRCTGILGERFVRDLRIRVFSHLMTLSTRYFDRAPRGSLMSRLTSDIDALQDLVQLGLVQFLQSALTVTVLLVLLSLLSWRLTIACTLPMPLLVLVSRSFHRRSRRAYLVVRERVANTLGTLVESLAGIRVVQAYCQEASRIERFLRDNEGHCEAILVASRVQATFLPVIEISTVLSIALTLGVGGWLVVHGRETLGTVSAFSVYLLMAFEPVQSLSALLNTLQSAAAALEKLFAVLDEVTDLPEGELDLTARAPLSLHHVDFSYAVGGTPILSDVSLTLAHGERLAIVGATGAGKSTLAKLMARLDDPTGGRVCYGGVDVRVASFRSLRRRIVMVAQEGHIFAGSVADNLRAVRPEASDAELHEALRRIGAYDRFERMPRGLQSPVGARGALLSSGERQLLALARVALLDADVLIFDEATSSLDTGTENLVNRALETLMADRTVVIVAHRLSTMRRVNRIAVVADGRIAELGTHAELIARNERYATLYRQWRYASALPAECTPGVV
jgi:ATP-binding cassette subfamily B protein